jgi:isoleucyl-tRNA synthetase
VIKDRLYCEAADSAKRRSAQATVYEIIRSTLSALAPIMAFTADEAWRYLPGEENSSVFLGGRISEPELGSVDEELIIAGKALLETRDALNLVFESKVKSKQVGHRREVEAVLTIPSETIELISTVSSDLAEVFAVSSVEVKNGGTLAVEVRRSTAQRCTRCWRHRLDIGTNNTYPDLCKRCATVLTSLEKTS